jgi:Ser/Thr protein kinase RdoA (MazF antagonist)
LADRVNGCLTERLEVIPEKEADLLAALGAYHQAVAALTNDETAYLEVLLRASTDVARFLREHKDNMLAAGTLASGEQKAESVTEAESEGQKAASESEKEKSTEPGS